MFNLMSYITKYISALLSVLLCGIVSFPFILSQGQSYKEIDIAEQNSRIEQLEKDYSNGNYRKTNEYSITDFDIQKAYSDNVKYNEVSFIATHNSYQLACTPAYTQLMNNLSTLTFGLVSSEITAFNSDTLTEQFNLGIRSIELDIETIIKDGEPTFVCSHSPVIDQTSCCYDFALALKEIKMWSDANPNHLPITVIIEPKKVFIPEYGMRYFNLKYANALDDLLRKTFGSKLITPADMMGNHSSLKEMREADDWLTLEETSGHVIFLLHDTTVTNKYIKQDPDIKSQAMFPMLRYKSRDESYASFLLINKPDDAIKYSTELMEKNLIFRTQADTYGNHTDEKRTKALDSMAQIMSTDYPTKTSMSSVDYTLTFDGGYTVVLNAQN